MTIQEVEEQALTLGKTLGTKVYPMCFETELKELVVGFVREPSLQAKIAGLEMLAKSTIDAGEIILKSSLIEEHSSPRFTSLNPMDDNLKISAYLACAGIVRIYENLIKKN
jgi:hypothetical protein